MVGVVWVNRLSASGTFHAEPKISILTDRTVTDCALYAGQSVEFVTYHPLVNWLRGFGENARLADVGGGQRVSQNLSPLAMQNG